MAFPQGINCRSTQAFVTDGANEDWEKGTDGFGNGSYPHTTAQGNTIGTEDSFNDVNRNSGIDRRFAGLFYQTTSGFRFRIDLPSSGQYSIRIAAGDYSFANAHNFDLYDTTTQLATLCTGNMSTADRFADAQNAEYSSTNWPGSNTARTATFSTTICRIQTTTTDANCLAHVYIESAGAGGRTTKNTRSAPLGMELGMGWRM